MLDRQFCTTSTLHDETFDMHTDRFDEEDEQRLKLMFRQNLGS